MKIGYTLYHDGSFAVTTCAGPQLADAYPSIDGRPLRAVSVETGENYILYHLADGDIRLDFDRLSETSFSIRASLLHFTKKIHTLTIADALLPTELAGVYQAAGELCSDCGYRRFDEVNRRLPMTSRGLTVLCRKNGYLVCYVADHTGFHQEFQFRKAENGRTSLCGSFRLENVNPADLVLPPMFFAAEESLDAALKLASESIAEKMQARHTMPPAYHWCSWYYNYSEFNQSQLTEYLQGFRQTEPGQKLRYFQIDAGYSSAVGDWLSPRSYWPSGLESAIHEVRDAGYQPGIWVGPFMAGNHSIIAKEHPDWLLRDLAGNPIIGILTDGEPKLWGYHDEEYYILDSSHPEVMDYLRQVFRTMRAWGVKLFKTDFMLWGYQDSSNVRRHTPGKTSVEYFRDVVKMIREEIGEDSYWLGCIAPFYPFIGYADAMRIGGDVGSSWNGQFGPLNMIMTVKGNYYTNGRYYQNDPDATFFRDFHIRLNDTEIEALAIYAALSGGCTYTSDPVHKLREDRSRLLSFLEPDTVYHMPTLPYLEDNRDDVVFVCKNADTGKGLVLIFNPTEKPVMDEYDLAKLGFAEEVWVSERMPVSGASTEPYRAEKTLILKTPSHGCRLMVISEGAPARFCEDNLWKNLYE